MRFSIGLPSVVRERFGIDEHVFVPKQDKMSVLVVALLQARTSSAEASAHPNERERRHRTGAMRAVALEVAELLNGVHACRHDSHALGLAVRLELLPQAEAMLASGCVLPDGDRHAWTAAWRTANAMTSALSTELYLRNNQASADGSGEGGEGESLWHSPRCRDGDLGCELPALPTILGRSPTLRAHWERPEQGREEELLRSVVDVMLTRRIVEEWFLPWLDALAQQQPATAASARKKDVAAGVEWDVPLPWLPRQTLGEHLTHIGAIESVRRLLALGAAPQLRGSPTLRQLHEPIWTLYESLLLDDDGAGVMSAAPPSQRKALTRIAQPVRGVPDALEVTSLLTLAECEQLVQLTRAVGFVAGDSLAANPMRTNRVALLIVGEEMAAALSRRLAPLLPTSGHDGSVRAAPHFVNRFWRVYRYAPPSTEGADDAEVFGPHLDGEQCNGGGGCSTDHNDASGRARSTQMSVLIYLTDGHTGGETILYPEGEGGTAVSITPHKGNALAFYHGAHPLSLRHEGAPLTAVGGAPKLVVRTDIVFEHVDPAPALSRSAQRVSAQAALMQRFFEECAALRKLDLSADTPPEHPLMRAADGANKRSAKAQHKNFIYMQRHKLRHDAQQLELLVSRGRLPSEPWAEVAAEYYALLEELPKGRAGGAGDELTADRLKRYPLVGRTLNRAVHLTRPPRLPSNETVLSPSFDGLRLQRAFYASDLEQEIEGCDRQNGLAYVDGVLSEAALRAFKQWCDESTMWFETKAGYLGAYLGEAFNAPLLQQLSEELKQALPEILGPYEMTSASVRVPVEEAAWAYKYSNEPDDWEGAPGIKIHADRAAINLNLWLSEDEANLEDGVGGGLRVFTRQAPKEWKFTDYNTLDSVRKMEEWVAGSRAIEVPHKQNRMAIFNSNLLHATMDPKFRRGFTKRRINLTLLFGVRCEAARQ